MPAEVLQEEVVQQIRIERISAAQDEEMWIHSLKIFLRGDWSSLTAEVASTCGKIEMNYALDDDELLLYCPYSGTADEDRDGMFRLVIPESLQQDFLHHTIESGRGTPRNRPYVPADTETFPLERPIPKCATLCGYLC